MKKLAAIILIMCLILCACGPEQPEKAESFICGTGARQCFAMNGDTLISAAESGVRGFDLMGENIFDIQTDMVYPAVCRNGSSSVIYDVGGTAVVYGDGSLLEFGNVIISASLSDGGYLAICAEEAGYKGAVTVYSPEKSPVYKWYSAEQWIIDAAVSPDGKCLAVLCSGENGAEIHMLEIDGESELGLHSAPEMLSDIFWQGDRLCGVGDSGLYYCNAEGRDKGGYKFGKLSLGSYTMWGEKLVIELRAHSFGGTGELVVIDENGKESGRIRPKGEIISLDCAEAGVLCLTQSEVTLYDAEYNEAFTVDITGAEAAFLRQTGDILAVGSGNARAIEY